MTSRGFITPIARRARLRSIAERTRRIDFSRREWRSKLTARARARGRKRDGREKSRGGQGCEFEGARVSSVI